MAVEKIKLVPEVPTTAGEYERKRNSDGTTGWADNTPQPTLTYSCDPGLGVYAKVNNNLVLSGTKLPLGTEVTLTVVPMDGLSYLTGFKGWSDGVGAPERTITMTDDVDVRALKKVSTPVSINYQFIDNTTGVTHYAHYAFDKSTGTRQELLLGGYPVCVSDQQISFDRGENWVDADIEGGYDVQECIVVEAYDASSGGISYGAGTTNLMKSVVPRDDYNSTDTVDAYFGPIFHKSIGETPIYIDKTKEILPENFFFDVALTQPIPYPSVIKSITSYNGRVVNYFASWGTQGDRGYNPGWDITTDHGTYSPYICAWPGDTMKVKKSINSWPTIMNPFTSSFDDEAEFAAPIATGTNSGYHPVSPAVCEDVQKIDGFATDGTNTFWIGLDGPTDALDWASSILPHQGSWYQVYNSPIGHEYTYTDSGVLTKDSKFYYLDESVDPPTFTELTSWKTVDKSIYKGIKVNLLPDPSYFRGVELMFSDATGNYPRTEITNEKWMKISNSEAGLYVSLAKPGNITWEDGSTDTYRYLDPTEMSTPGYKEFTVTYSAPTETTTVSWTVDTGGTVTAYDIDGNVITSPHSCTVGKQIYFELTPDTGMLPDNEHLQNRILGGWHYAVGPEDELTFNWKSDTSYHTLTFSATNGSVSATVDGTAVTSGSLVQEGSEIVFTDTPSSGYKFSQWSDGNTDNPRTVEMPSSNFSITATNVADIDFEQTGISSASSGKLFNVSSNPAISSLFDSTGKATKTSGISAHIAGEFNGRTIDMNIHMNFVSSTSWSIRNHYSYTNSEYKITLLNYIFDSILGEGYWLAIQYLPTPANSFVIEDENTYDLCKFVRDSSNDGEYTNEFDPTVKTTYYAWQSSGTPVVEGNVGTTSSYPSLFDDADHLSISDKTYHNDGGGIIVEINPV